MHARVLAFVLAGGKGTRLYPLTKERAKPAVPFGGRYRIVDFVLSNLVNSGILDATRPHIVIYEAIPGGGLKLIGADYLLIASTWNATHSGPPELMGQLFHLFDSPNRFGLPAFYTLHVWA